MPNWTNDDGYSEFGKDDMDGPVTRPKSKKSISDVLPTDAEHEAEARGLNKARRIYALGRCTVP